MAQVVSTLQVRTAPERFSFWSRPKETFIGKVDAFGFRLRRNINTRYSFLPFAHGEYGTSSTTTLIHLHLRFHPVVLVFIGVWMGGFGLAALGVTYASITSNVINPMMFAPIGMFLFRCVPTMGGFLNDCRRMLDELRRSLSAEGFEPIRSS